MHQNLDTIKGANKGKFSWTNEVDNGFEYLKKRVAQQPIVVLTDFDKVLTIECDAKREDQLHSLVKSLIKKRGSTPNMIWNRMPLSKLLKSGGTIFYPRNLFFLLIIML